MSSRASSPALSLDAFFALAEDPVEISHQPIDDASMPSPRCEAPRVHVRSPSPVDFLDLTVAHPRRREVHRCRVCDGRHPLRACSRFRNLSVERRLRAVLQYRYCSRCLAHTHTARDCHSTAGCSVCTQTDHNTMLHVEYRPRPVRRQTIVATRQPALTSASSRRTFEHIHPGELMSAPVTLLPTCTVQVVLGKHRVKLRALLDACAEHTSMSDELQTRLNLHPTRIGDEAMCTLTVSSIHDKAMRLSLSVHIVPELKTMTPVRDVPKSVVDAFRNFKLADSHFHIRGSVQLIIGGNYYHKLVLPSIIQQRGLPMAQDTVLGWVISGPCTP